MPIVFYKNALFLSNEISGMDIPDSLIEQYKDLNWEEAEELAVQISLDTSRKISQFVDGYYIMTPFRRVLLSQRIVEIIKAME